MQNKINQILYDISNEDYHNSERFAAWYSSSELKSIYDSPQIFKIKQDDTEPQKRKQCFDFGSAYHAYIQNKLLGNSFLDFEDEITIFEHPRNNKSNEPMGITTKAYKEAAEAAGEQSISDIDYQKIKEMSKAFFASRYVRNFFRNCKNIQCETTYLTEINDVKVKVRTDIDADYCGSHIIADLKTCKFGESSKHNVQKPIIDYSLDFSAAMYQIVVHNITGIWKPFYWIFQENVYPYQVNIQSAKNYAIEVYRDYFGTNAIINSAGIKFYKAVDVLKKCIEKNSFPGSEIFIKNKVGIGDPMPPNWYMNEHKDFYVDKI